MKLIVKITKKAKIQCMGKIKKRNKHATNKKEYIILNKSEKKINCSYSKGVV